MKVAVIGGRKFDDYERMKSILDLLPITRIISGGARGADKLSERYATENNIPTKIYLPDWDLFGKKAGFLRNTTIIENSDIVIAFWDGRSRGTRDSIGKANKLKKNTFFYNNPYREVEFYKIQWQPIIDNIISISKKNKQKKVLEVG